VRALSGSHSCGATHLQPAGADGKVGIDTPFEPAGSYANWWWGITPSALRGMLTATGFDAKELAHDPFNMTVIARPAK
jgi:hypothetical protein